MTQKHRLQKGVHRCIPSLFEQRTNSQFEFLHITHSEQTNIGEDVVTLRKLKHEWIHLRWKWESVSTS